MNITLDSAKDLIEKLRSKGKQRKLIADLKFLMEFLTKSYAQMDPDTREYIRAEITSLKQQVQVRRIEIKNLAMMMQALQQRFQSLGRNCDWLGIDKFINQLRVLLALCGISYILPSSPMTYEQKLDYAIELLTFLDEERMALVRSVS